MVDNMGIEPIWFLVCKTSDHPLQSHRPFYYLENFIKRTLPVFILYSCNAAHHSVTVTISLSPRAVALKLLTASPKTPSTEGNLSTPNFHPSFRIFEYHKSSLKFSNQSEPWATRTTIGFPFHFWKGCRLNPIVLHSLYLLTSCGRGLQGSSPSGASIVGATSLGVPLLTLHLCHYFFIGGWYTTCPYPLSVQRSLPLWGIPLTKTRQFHSAHAELIRPSF